ncbi:MAG: hypothetical protein V1729_01245 [Candidatus Woesearchaeota archaeon]
MNQNYQKNIDDVEETGISQEEFQVRASNDPFFYLPEVCMYRMPRNPSVRDEPEAPYDAVNAFCLAITGKR